MVNSRFWPNYAKFHWSKGKTCRKIWEMWKWIDNYSPKFFCCEKRRAYQLSILGDSKDNICFDGIYGNLGNFCVCVAQLLMYIGWAQWNTASLNIHFILLRLGTPKNSDNFWHILVYKNWVINSNFKNWHLIPGKIAASKTVLGARCRLCFSQTKFFSVLDRENTQILVMRIFWKFLKYAPVTISLPLKMPLLPLAEPPPPPSRLSDPTDLRNPPPRKIFQINAHERNNCVVLHVHKVWNMAQICIRKHH